MHQHASLLHGLLVGAGVSAALAVVWAEARRRGLADERLLVLIAAGLVGGAVGMRVAGLVRALDDVGGSATVLDAWRYGAKSVLGGLAGAYAGVLVGKRLTRTPVAPARCSRQPSLWGWPSAAGAAS